MFITIEKLGTSYNKLHNFSKLFYFASFLKNGLYDGILILHFQNAFYTFRESVSKKYVYLFFWNVFNEREIIGSSFLINITY